MTLLEEAISGNSTLAGKFVKIKCGKEFGENFQNSGIYYCSIGSNMFVNSFIFGPQE